VSVVVWSVPRWATLHGDYIALLGD